MTARDVICFVLGSGITGSGLLVGRHFRGADFHSNIAMSIGVAGLAVFSVLVIALWRDR